MGRTTRVRGGNTVPCIRVSCGRKMVRNIAFKLRNTGMDHALFACGTIWAAMPPSPTARTRSPTSRPLGPWRFQQRTLAHPHAARSLSQLSLPGDQTAEIYHSLCLLLKDRARAALHGQLLDSLDHLLHLITLNCGLHAVTLPIAQLGRICQVGGCGDMASRAQLQGKCPP